MFIFFDGEEAFDTWGPTDSIYGARHLADKWHSVKQTYGDEDDISNLDKMVIAFLYVYSRNFKILTGFKNFLRRLFRSRSTVKEPLNFI